ncbi:MAG: ATP-binding protein [Syntrophobacteraceae bacterium]
MKIAFTGTSCTGKTTLSYLLREEPWVKSHLPLFITVDARSLLTSRGFQSVDRMSPHELRDFQTEYLSKKIHTEDGQDNYITDRSFVDVAAYWIERDAEGLPLSDVEPYVERCREEVKRYDTHFYFPFGIIQFESDGFRSEDLDFHTRIDLRIQKLLKEWNLRVETLNSRNLLERREIVTAYLRDLWRHNQSAGE